MQDKEDLVTPIKEEELKECIKFTIEAMSENKSLIRLDEHQVVDIKGIDADKLKLIHYTNDNVERTWIFCDENKLVNNVFFVVRQYVAKETHFDYRVYVYTFTSCRRFAKRND